MTRVLVVAVAVALATVGCGDDAGPEATPEQAEAIGTLIDAELTNGEQRCILEELIATQIEPAAILDGTITGDEDAELLAIAVSCVDDLATVPAFVQSVIDASSESGTPFTENEAMCVIDKMADEDPVTAAADCIGADGGGAGSPIDGYGDDATLDLLWDACDGGNNQVCDELYLSAPLDSRYLEFARTCAGQLPDSVGFAVSSTSGSDQTAAMPVHIALAIRTPFTRVEGALAGWHPVDLAAELMNAELMNAELMNAELMNKVGQGSEDRPTWGEVDEVFVGCAEPVGAQGANMARAAILAAGWPDHISGAVVDRAETSGTAALHAAAAAIEAGMISRALVLGVCSASVVAPGASALARTYGRPWGDGPAARVEGEGGLLPAPVAADRTAAAAGITRSEQDAWAMGSCERRGTVVSPAITPIGAQPGERVAIQRGASIDNDDLRGCAEDPASLAPSFDRDGSVTGFTFAPSADGVTALVLTSDPIGPEIIGVGRAAGHPLDSAGGVVGAVDSATRGLAVKDGRRSGIARWEITEPTAAAVLVAISRLGIDPGLVNQAGGTLGVGDAGAAEELRLLADGIALAASGDLLCALAHGPTGAAATLVRCP